jgi:hypothetical protein
MLSLAIVATISDSRDSIEAFIRYHTAIGFSTIYLFIDDNDEQVLETLKKYTQVTAFLRNAALAAQWETHYNFHNNEKRKLIDTEVMVRQELNFFVAYALSKLEGIDWLIHIDLDELFYPNGNDLQEHFKFLQRRNFRGMTYLNYESVSTDINAPNIYLSTEYFKINYFWKKHWFFSKPQQEFIKDCPWLREKYFHFYQNGKSSISTYGREVRFYDVHSIVGDGHRKLGGKSDPLILHFPCARFSDFVTKYSRLGDFSDIWMGHKRAGEFIDEIHLHARDFYSRNAGNKEALLKFYIENFMFDQLKISALIEHGLAKHIPFHISVLMPNA